MTLCATCRQPIPRERRTNGTFCSLRCIRARPMPGASHPNARLTEDQVRDIRRRHAAGETTRALANEFGVTMPAVWWVINRGWRNVV